MTGWRTVQPLPYATGIRLLLLTPRLVSCTPGDQLVLNLYAASTGYVPGQPGTVQGGAIVVV